jgi:23S rRNA pseudouridine2605 synthase
LLGAPNPEQLRELQVGVELDEGRTRIESVEKAGGGGNNVWFEVVLREGRHRELRASFAAVGIAVSRVIRVKFGPIELGKLRRGTSRPLSSAETEALYALAGMPLPRAAAAKPTGRKGAGSARSKGERPRRTPRRSR